MSMNQNRRISYKCLPTVILSGMLGSLFVVSALLKIYAFKTFQGEVRLYLEAYFPNDFIGYERVLAAFICIIELIMGLCAIIGIKRKRYVLFI